MPAHTHTRPPHTNLMPLNENGSSQGSRWYMTRTEAKYLCPSYFWSLAPFGTQEVFPRLIRILEGSTTDLVMKCKHPNCSAFSRTRLVSPPGVHCYPTLPALRIRSQRAVRFPQRCPGTCQHSVAPKYAGGTLRAGLGPNCLSILQLR